MWLEAISVYCITTLMIVTLIPISLYQTFVVPTNCYFLTVFDFVLFYDDFSVRATARTTRGHD